MYRANVVEGPAVDARIGPPPEVTLSRCVDEASNLWQRAYAISRSFSECIDGVLGTPTGEAADGRGANLPAGYVAKLHVFLGIIGEALDEIQRQHDRLKAVL